MPWSLSGANGTLVSGDGVENIFLISDFGMGIADLMVREDGVVIFFGG
jgi:hypothetical protein